MLLFLLSFVSVCMGMHAGARRLSHLLPRTILGRRSAKDSSCSGKATMEPADDAKSSGFFSQVLRSYAEGAPVLHIMDHLLEDQPVAKMILEASQNVKDNPGAPSSEEKPLIHLKHMHKGLFHKYKISPNQQLLLSPSSTAPVLYMYAITPEKKRIQASDIRNLFDLLEEEPFKSLQKECVRIHFSLAHPEGFASVAHGLSQLVFPSSSSEEDSLVFVLQDLDPFITSGRDLFVKQASSLGAFFEMCLKKMTREHQATHPKTTADMVLMLQKLVEENNLKQLESPATGRKR